MKSKLTRVLIVLLAVTLFYSSCKRSETIKPITAAQPNPDAVAKQIAMSLYKSLTGQMGGTNINDGVKVPASFTTHNGKTLDAVSSLCGFTIDTAYSSYTTVRDTDYWQSVKFKWKNLCVLNNNVNGFTVYDSIRTNASNAAFLNSYTNIQQYNAVALDNTFKITGVDGRIRTWTSATTNASATVKGEYHALECDYKLIALVIDLSGTTADIKGGVATYTSSTKDIDQATGVSGVTMNYKGNIIFLGHQKAKLTIDPKHYYTIDFSNNTITPIN